MQENQNETRANGPWKRKRIVLRNLMGDLQYFGSGKPTDDDANVRTHVPHGSVTDELVYAVVWILYWISYVDSRGRIGGLANQSSL
jgi:hypothetical protein